MCYKSYFLGSCIYCDIFKQALENSANEFRSICASKDVAIRISQKFVKM